MTQLPAEVKTRELNITKPDSYKKEVGFNLAVHLASLLRLGQRRFYLWLKFFKPKGGEEFGYNS